MWQWLPSRSEEQVGSHFLSFQVMNYSQIFQKKSLKFQMQFRASTFPAKETKVELNTTLRTRSLCVSEENPFLLGKASICNQACPGLSLFLETLNVTIHGNNQTRKNPRAIFDLPVL